jgi:hypothetical protein
LMLMIGPRFTRVEPRRRAAAFVQGLLAGLPRANCWTIAEHAGEACPRGMQRLLSSAVIDTEGLRDDLRAYVVRHLTRNEIRRLFTSLTDKPPPIRQLLNWSCWRRLHQATARRCHYQRREALAA